MAAAEGIWKELECPICCEVYTKATIAGQCGHTFCKLCIQNWIESSNAAGYFECPLCRKHCNLPSNGVEGLTTNYILCNIIDKSFSKGKDTPGSQGVQDTPNQKLDCCQMCRKSVNEKDTLICTTCGDLLCEHCALQHVNSIETASHILTNKCVFHGEPLQKFCSTCCAAVCCSCDCTNSKGRHDVVEYCAIVMECKRNLEKLATKCGKESDVLIEQAAVIENMVREKREKTEALKTSVTGEFEEKIQSHDAEIQRLLMQVETLQIEKTKLLDEKTELLTKIDEEHSQSISDLNLSKGKIESVNDEMQRLLKKSTALLSGKVLSSRVHDDIKSLSQKLNEVLLEEGIEISNALDQVPGLSQNFKSKVKYTCISATYSRDLIVPDSEFNVFGISHLIFRGESSIVACGRSQGKRHTCYQWKFLDHPPCVLNTSDQALRDLTIVGDCREIALLRVGSPTVQIFDVVSKGGSSFDVDLQDEPEEAVRSIDFVDDQRYLFTYCDRYGKDHLILTNKKGAVVDSVVTEKGYKTAYCRRSSSVYLCTPWGDTIHIYKVDGMKLNHVRSARHGIRGFRCCDICCNTNNDIFIVGLCEGELRVYQLVERVRPRFDLIRTSLTGVEIGKVYRLPTCSVNDSELVIGYGQRMRVFTLTQSQ